MQLGQVGDDDVGSRGGQGRRLAHPVDPDDVAEVAGAPGLDLPKLDVASVAEGYGIKAHRTADRDGAAGALATALASSKPELVEVPVAPGMSLF